MVACRSLNCVEFFGFPLRLESSLVKGVVIVNSCANYLSQMENGLQKTMSRRSNVTNSATICQVGDG